LQLRDDVVAGCLPAGRARMPRDILHLGFDVLKGALTAELEILRRQRRYG
jgi:hypothetical protein